MPTISDVTPKYMMPDFHLWTSCMYLCIISSPTFVPGRTRVTLSQNASRFVTMCLGILWKVRIDCDDAGVVVLWWSSPRNNDVVALLQHDEYIFTETWTLRNARTSFRSVSLDRYIYKKFVRLSLLGSSSFVAVRHLVPWIYLNVLLKLTWKNNSIVNWRYYSKMNTMDILVQ